MPITTYQFEGDTLDIALVLASEKLKKPRENLKYSVNEEEGKFVISVEEEIDPQQFHKEVETISKTFFSEIFSFYDFPGDVQSIEYNDNYFIVSLRTANDLLFIKNNAVVLLALQELINAVAKRKLGFEPRIILDCKEFRYHRNNFLKEIARERAKEVKRTGRSFLFLPLDSYERKIIHMSLQDDQDVTTQSEGNSKYKRVKIMHVRKKQ